MQDAFTKTVPIWCAVLNRAVREFRDKLRPASHSSDGQECEHPSSDAAHWDCDIHVPPWVSENEANHITGRLDDWTKELLQVCWAPSMSPKDHFHHISCSAATICMPHVLQDTCGCVELIYKERAEQCMIRV